MTPHLYTQTIGGKTFTVELTDWAEQAHGSVLVRLGDTAVLGTAVMSPLGREGMNFFPLTVEYEEKFYAAGKILGSRFIKRETRPSEEAILVARLIDRAIRPRFDLRMRNEVQVVLTVLSIDDENDPDIPALLAASLALSLSPIPWNGPIAGCRVGRKDGTLLINPMFAEREASDLDCVIAGTGDRVNMLEAGAREISETDFADAAERAFPSLQELIAFQNHIAEAHGKKKTAPTLLPLPDELQTLIKKEFSKDIEDALYRRDKQNMQNSLKQVEERMIAQAREMHPTLFDKNVLEHLFHEEINQIIHKRIIEKKERPDGRSPDELRPLRAQAGLFPRVHGSGLFMRGETHVLSSLTLGAPGDQQIIEGMEIRTKRRFLHHYNFPPYSTGEVKPMRGPGRREIGHGALAGKALLPVIPPVEEFPYTIRIVSEALSSNGSTSMASVCGSSLALMDAGVPVKRAVAGAAMGLIANEKGEYVVLTDIQGPEDHHGDMDFKVAGTREGITAVQMDVKIEGITFPMLRDALLAAHRSRMRILDHMDSVISEPRENLNPYAPRITTLKINPEKIGALIGPGGKVINDIIAKTGAQIDIEDDGTVFVTSVNEEGMQKALGLIKQVTREFKPGELMEGKVTRLFEFGAMVEVGPRQEGLVHISELAPWRVERVEDIVHTGDVIPVMVKNIDDQGRLNLSLKDVPGRYPEGENRAPSRPAGGAHHDGRSAGTMRPQKPYAKPFARRRPPETGSFHRRRS